MCIVCARGLVPADDSVFARQTLEHPESATEVTDWRALVTSSWNRAANFATISGVSAFISFSFETAPTEVAQGYGEAYAASFQPFTEAQVAMARAALQLWADASGITFFEVPAGQGDIRFAGNFDFSTGGPHPPNRAAAYAGYPGSGGGGDVYFGSSSYAYMQIFLHEIGHALGLKHSFDGDFVLGPNDDNYSRTVMSYTSGGRPGDVLGSLDIEAIQYLYGTNARDGTHVASWSWDAATYTLTQTGRDTADVLRGMGAGNSIINAMGGDDFVRGSDGIDTVYGGAGNDRIESGAGNDFVDGGDGDDTVYAGAGNDRLIGGAGRDNMLGEAGDDTLDGDDGNDFLYGQVGNDILRGGVGDDQLYGNEGDDLLEGGDGADSLSPGTGNDTARGGGGGDYFYVTWAAGSTAIIDGGDGNDTLSIQAYSTFVDGGFVSERLDIDLMTLGSTGRLTMTSIETLSVSGGEQNDRILGAAANDSFAGGAGDDILEGRDGADNLSGGDGDDVLDGGAGNDSLATGLGNDTVRGGDGNDWIYLTWDQNARVEVDGGAGNDGIVIQGQGSWVNNVWVVPSMSVDLAAAQAAGRLILQGVENLYLYGGASADVLSGTSVRDNMMGEAGDDLLLGAGGSDVLQGGAGNDVLVGGTGGDFLYGGDGYDVAAYSGAVRGYNMTTSTMVQAGHEGGTDSLTGVETLAFLDGQLTFHRDGMAAQVMRLYDSAFNRIPDASGFEAQLDAMESGLSLEALAQLFVDSAEFQNTYGALNERQFVEQLYRNVLDREGDEAGITNALTFLAGNSRGDLVVAFSESTEHKNLTQGTLDQGLWIADEQTLIIARLYDAAWNRLPDEGGLITWRNALGAGMSLEDIADAFAGAAEFTNTYGTLTDRQFIEQLYRNVLNREADEGGIQNALNAIAGGSSWGDIMLAFSESAEHIAVTRDLWIGGVSLYGSASAPVGAKEADEPQTLPGADDFVPLDAGNDDGALVLPGVDDALVWAKEADEALVLPGLDDGAVFVAPFSPDHVDFDHRLDLLDDAFIALRNEGWMH